MEAENSGCSNSLRRGYGEQQSRYCYGINFSNIPPGVRNVDLEQLFGDFGQCRVYMNPGARHGWVGYNTMQSCNDAIAGLQSNMLGMCLRRGGPMFQPPVVDQYPMSYGPPFRPRRGLPLSPMDYYGDDFYDDYDDELYDFYSGMSFGGSLVDQMYGKQADYAFGPCTHCNRRTAYSCDRCEALYCSERCLSDDWSRHKDECNNTMPGLNRRPRNLSAAGNFRDVGERLPIHDGLDGCSDSDRPGSRRSDRAPEACCSSENRSNSSERPNGSFQQTQRRQGGFDRNEERRPNGGFNRRQNQRTDNATDRNDNRRRPSDDRPDTGFPSRNDRRTNEDHRRVENGFPRRNGNCDNDRREHGDRYPTGDRPSENGFAHRSEEGDRRGGSERHRSENGFNDRRTNEDHRRVENGFPRRNGNCDNDRREHGDRYPTGDRPSENGFAHRSEEGDRRGGSERRPMKTDSPQFTGGHRSENGFNDRRRDGDCGPMRNRYNNGFKERRPMGDRRGDNDRRPQGERRNESKSSDGRPGENEANNAGRESSSNEMKRAASSPAERGVCINLKNNDPVIIAAIAKLNSIHLTPPMSAYSEEFLKMSKALACHCEDAPSLESAPAPNEIVACRFDLDGQFYRAVVKRVLPGEQYLMEFVDYGNTQKCKLNELKAVPDELKKCPRNAVEVSLRGVDAVPLSKKIEDFIGELGNNLVKLKVQFGGDISEGVELIMPNGVSVNQEVRSMSGQAEKLNKKDTSAPKADTPAPKADTPAPKADTPAPKADTPASKADTPASKADTPACKAGTPASEAKTPASKAETPASKTDTQASKADTSASKAETPASKTDTQASKADTSASKAETPASKTGTHASKADVPVPEENTPKDTAVLASKQLNIAETEQALSTLLKKLQQLEFPTAHPSEKGDCIKFNSGDTVVISVSENTDSTYITSPTLYEPESDFLNLTRSLIEHCSKSPALDRKPRQNEIVGCCDSNEIFCRAIVSEELPDGAYNMYFCDFGNVERCTADKLREIPNDMKILPRQAVKVRFRDVDPVPVTGKIQEILQQLIDEGVPLKIRFDDSMANGIELLRSDGRSVNEELRAIIAQEKSSSSEAEGEEDLSPVDSLPLPDKPFELLVYGIPDEYTVMACAADVPEIREYYEKYVPIIQDYCNARPEEEYRPKTGDMCLAKFKNEWFRGIAIKIEKDETREVLLVDQGETCKIKPKDLRKIPQHIRTPLRTLSLCTLEGVPESAENWAKIEARIKSDIKYDGRASFENVTSVTEHGITTVNVPELRSLFSK